MWLHHFNRLPLLPCLLWSLLHFFTTGPVQVNSLVQSEEWGGLLLILCLLWIQFSLTKHMTKNWGCATMWLCNTLIKTLSYTAWHHASTLISEVLCTSLFSTIWLIEMAPAIHQTLFAISQDAHSNLYCETKQFSHQSTINHYPI
jgi:hypothetical protein